MSERVETSGHGVRAEEDRVPTLRLAAIGIGALVLFVGASLTSVWVMDAQIREALPDGPPAMPSELGKQKIGIVEQQLFENATRWTDERDAQRRKLESYGWVDRKAGVVHIPVDRAMDLVVQGGSPGAKP